MDKQVKNVLGTELCSCCFVPMTGFYRDGFCKTGGEDVGTHVVCAVMTEEFLEFTKSKGNDLSTPIPQWNFPGLQEGDKWCLCISRWIQAEKAGVAPKVILEATHMNALKFTTLEVLSKYEVKN
ncbi:DUF2237 family protein [Maribacter sp. 4G9]|uniref:DUF2237 family protein n=1 Tax=Maribacter sp. 4G9 TaxID=1889777 RepID=UPI000C14EDAE|nr:DUF2237 domain-containing protein [Maribacter sp. 4G9]PIB39331.1 hypothetical protein BFP75_12170 [Maribacter sp. 4G9]